MANEVAWYGGNDLGYEGGSTSSQVPIREVLILIRVLLRDEYFARHYLSAGQRHRA
ncbi:hypothetical protein BDZ94DRAFT_1250387 [Collybia nuda]|uniref:Uncharacterized protein n=1 Tax=Collybia nuda TaxID=64659 RepID=A0A9P5YE70_9AGAR|nr:hypothetical protein BDZ94DRAFT_1250387 [Collybia nuda]